MNWEDWNEDEEKRVIPKIPGAFLWRYSTETYVGKSKASIEDLFEVE